MHRFRFRVCTRQAGRLGEALMGLPSVSAHALCGLRIPTATPKKGIWENRHGF